ncbi:MAG: hypothetical protein WD875_00935 [Pirellulales bacterium]
MLADRPNNVDQPITDKSVDDSPALAGPGTRNRLGEVGLCLAIVAFIGLLLAAISEVAYTLTFLSVPASILSLVALMFTPRRWAWWGLGLGILVDLYVPTMLIFMFR